jgi:hypothetical protein
MQRESDEDYLLADRGGTQRGRWPKLAAAAELQTQKSNYVFNEMEDEGENNDAVEEDVVTPYSICNNTNVKLLVKRLNYGGSDYDNLTQSHGGSKRGGLGER